MNTGLHKYLTPLILINLISAANIYEVENITFTCMKWYKMIDMINENYSNMKRNIEYTGKRYEIEKKVLNDYFDTTDDTLIYYFKKSLEHLREANIINFQEINWVCIREFEEYVIDCSEPSKTNISIKHIHRRATQDEMIFIRQCDQDACLFAKIKHDDYTAKFYGENSYKYLKRYKELLLEKDIVFCYKAYEIYSTDKDIERCYKLLNSFDIKEHKALVSKLNSQFEKNIIMNAEKRIGSNLTKYKLYSKKDIKSFIKGYQKIIGYTIGPSNNLLDIPKEIEKYDEELMNTYINKKINIEYNGEKLKIGVEAIN